MLRTEPTPIAPSRFEHNGSAASTGLQSSRDYIISLGQVLVQLTIGQILVIWVMLNQLQADTLISRLG